MADPFSKTATREVTISLRGWHGETRQLSVVEPYWYVEIAFKCPGVTRVHTLFESRDRKEALAKYKAFKTIVD